MLQIKITSLNLGSSISFAHKESEICFLLLLVLIKGLCITSWPLIHMTNLDTKAFPPLKI